MSELTPEEVWAEVQKATGGAAVKPTVTRLVAPTYPGTTVQSGPPRNVTYVGDPPDGYKAGDLLTFHTPGDDGQYVLGSDGGFSVQQRPTPVKVAAVSNVKDVTLTAPVRQTDGRVLPVGIKVAADPKTGQPILDANGDYTITGGTAAALKALGVGGAGGGSGRAVSPSSAASAAATAAKLPGELELQGLNITKAQLDIEALKQKALPEQQRLLQQAQGTIDFIKSQIAAGTMTAEVADGYYKQVNDYVTSGLSGMTPYEAWKEQQSQITERAKLAKDILDQRMQSGSSLAANLNRDYTTGLTANGGLLVNPGPYNPIEEAKATVNDLGGGDRVSRIAQALLGPLMSGAGSPGTQPQSPSMDGGISPAGQAWIDSQGGATPVAPTDMGSGDLSPEGEAWVAEHSQEAA